MYRVSAKFDTCATSPRCAARKQWRRTDGRASRCARSTPAPDSGHTPVQATKWQLLAPTWATFSPAQACRGARRGARRSKQWGGQPQAGDVRAAHHVRLVPQLLARLPAALHLLALPHAQPQPADLLTSVRGAHRWAGCCSRLGLLAASGASCSRGFDVALLGTSSATSHGAGTAPLARCRR